MAAEVDELDGFYGKPRRRKTRRVDGSPWEDCDDGPVRPPAQRTAIVAAASGAAVAGGWALAAALAPGAEDTWSHVLALGVAAGTGVGAKEIGTVPAVYAGLGAVAVIAFPHASPIIVPAALAAAGTYTVMRRSS